MLEGQCILEDLKKLIYRKIEKCIEKWLQLVLLPVFYNYDEVYRGGILDLYSNHCITFDSVLNFFPGIKVKI